MAVYLDFKHTTQRKWARQHHLRISEQLSDGRTSLLVQKNRSGVARSAIPLSKEMKIRQAVSTCQNKAVKFGQQFGFGLLLDQPQGTPQLCLQNSSRNPLGFCVACVVCRCSVYQLLPAATPLIKIGAFPSIGTNGPMRP